MIAAGARALYAKDWEAQTGNKRDSHFDFEDEEVRAYWRNLALDCYVAMALWERQRQADERVRDADAARLELMIPKSIG
jgi:hypothetical protein